MENMVYVSPFFNTSSVIPAVALKTYKNRDLALISNACSTSICTPFVFVVSIIPLSRDQK